MTPLVAFAVGVALGWCFQRFLKAFAKSGLGQRTGIRAEARQKMLATLDHDALLSLADDTQAEIARRRT